MASFINRSGTITAGGTAQQLAPANENRRYLMVQNISDTDMWINDLGTATADSPSIKIAPGATVAWYDSDDVQEPLVPEQAISIICATTGKKWTAREL